MKRRFRIVKRKVFGASSAEYIIEYRVLRFLWWQKFERIRSYKADGTVWWDTTEFATAEDAERYLLQTFGTEKKFIKQRVLKYVKI